MLTPRQMAAWRKEAEEYADSQCHKDYRPDLWMAFRDRRFIKLAREDERKACANIVRAAQSLGQIEHTVQEIESRKD